MEFNNWDGRRMRAVPTFEIVTSIEAALVKFWYFHRTFPSLMDLDLIIAAGQSVVGERQVSHDLIGAVPIVSCPEKGIFSHNVRAVNARAVVERIEGGAFSVLTGGRIELVEGTAEKA